MIREARLTDRGTGKLLVICDNRLRATPLPRRDVFHSLPTAASCAPTCIVSLRCGFAFAMFILRVICCWSGGTV